MATNHTCFSSSINKNNNNNNNNSSSSIRIRRHLPCTVILLHRNRRRREVLRRSVAHFRRTPRPVPETHQQQGWQELHRPSIFGR
jgi:hypothetical protein